MKVLWTQFAVSSLQSIYNYYQTNVSHSIAEKICSSILNGSRQLQKYPYSGSTEPFLMELGENHRYILRGNYKIIYRISNSKVYITDVFDTRQDPGNLKKRTRNIV